MSGLNSDLNIAKTFKLFMNGEFPRTESGRSFPVYFAKGKKLYANLCLASRKDFRNAVSFAKDAQKSWSGKSAYNRSQILYRMAEMMEAKREEFYGVLQDTLGLTNQNAKKEVDDALTALVYYAGFCDKYSQVIGAVNPVAGPHHNFTTPEPVGSVVYIANEKFSLSHFMRSLGAILCSGNTLVMIMARDGAASIAPISEVMATSDLPKGVVNLLSGDIKELLETIGSHMEVESLCYDASLDADFAVLQKLGIENFKRLVRGMDHENNLQNILRFVEYKTVWHPIGN